MADTTRAEAIRQFLDEADWSDAKLSALPGDASTRRYFRVALGDRCAMLMDQPQAAETPPCPPEASAMERHALGYNAIARLAGADSARFVAAAIYLRDRGFSAPAIYAADCPSGFVLMEDLGDRLYADLIPQGADEAALYRGSVEALARLHAQTAPDVLGPGKPLYVYDETALLAETDLLTEWFVPLALNRRTADDEIAEHRTLWREAIRALPTSSPVFVHRDYHAQNLLWLPERRETARVGMIDFQDAVAGAQSYDLVSLLEDARRDVAPELAKAMSDHYLAAMAQQDIVIDRDAHAAEMALLAAQRNAKIVGIFARLYKRDGKPRYLGHLPRVWNYLSRDLEHPALAALKSWYECKIPHDVREQLPGIVS